MADLYLYEARARATERLRRIVADLSASERLTEGKASVYATGSYGRLEAGPRSDLDLFVIVATDRSDGPRRGKRLLSGLDEIRLKYDLLRVNEAHGLPDFDGDGKFLESHVVESYTRWLGSNEDDYRNTLTGRMLMLLESQPLIGTPLYDGAIQQVIDKYFRDYEGHEDEFVPSFLFNDILRMRRTFCVNYEFYRKVGKPSNKIKNLKLKFSRMLTCYSGVIYLLAIHAKQATVHPADVAAMVRISPTERLEAIARPGFWEAMPHGGVADIVRSALSGYSRFLELTHQDVEEAVRQYTAEEENWRERSYDFGRTLSSIIDLLGGLSPSAERLRRLIII